MRASGGYSELSSKEQERGQVIRQILRLESSEITQLIPHELKEAIQVCLKLDEPVDWKVSEIGSDEKYKRHYKNRINAINDGVNFLIDSLSQSTFHYGYELKSYLNGIALQCKNKFDLLTEKQAGEIGYYQNTLANYVAFVLAILQSELGLPQEEVTKQLSRAEEFALVKRTRPAVVTVSSIFNSDEYIAVIDKPENPFSEEIKAELMSIKMNSNETPAWFDELKEFEKNFVRKLLDDIEDIDSELGHTINALSSKLRLIPVPANYGVHTLITYIRSKGNIEPKVIVHPSIRRSSHTASRDVTGQKARQTHAFRNTAKEIHDAIEEKLSELKGKMEGKSGEGRIVIPILYQTLITPIKSPDSRLDEDKQKAVEYIQGELQDKIFEVEGREVQFVVISTNHPLNYGKYLNPTTPGGVNAKAIDLLLAILEDYAHLFCSEENKILLNDAIRKLVDCTKSYKKMFKPYRELYLSSLEQIVVLLAGGISIGSCVSGKDRKAIEIAHTEAMIIFYTKYGELPSFTDQQPEFAEIFAEVYCTKHQQYIAGQNAPGSFGTKTPDMYLPDHLKKAIQAWYVKHQDFPFYQGLCERDNIKESDIMASNNDIKHVKPCKISNEDPSQIWTAPSNINWHDSYQLNIHFLANNAIQGITVYTEIKKSELSKSSDGKGEPFSGLFASERARGMLRACVYLQLLNEAMHPFQMALLLYSLLANTDGTILREHVYKATGFTNLASSKKALESYLRRYLHDNKIEITLTNTIINPIIKVINGVSASNQLTVVDMVSDILKSEAINPHPSLALVGSKQ